MGGTESCATQVEAVLDQMPLRTGLCFSNNLHAKVHVLPAGHLQTFGLWFSVIHFECRSFLTCLTLSKDDSSLQVGEPKIEKRSRNTQTDPDPNKDFRIDQRHPEQRKRPCFTLTSSNVQLPGSVQGCMPSSFPCGSQPTIDRFSCDFNRGSPV